MSLRKKNSPEPALIDRTSFRVRFSEVDSMKIVWHGSYVKYCEDGRESFGKTYGLGYLDVYAQGYAIPLVNLTLDYKNPLIYGDEAIVETRFIDTEAAKIQFEYRIYRLSDNLLIAEAKSTQVFLNQSFELELNPPAFFIEWKKKTGIIA